MSDPLGVKKYQRKTLFVKLTRQLREIQERVHANQAAGQATVSYSMDKIKGLLDVEGVYSDLHHQYMAYALALEKSQAELAFMVDLIRQHQILRDRFERRGLDPATLDALDAMVIYRTRNR